MPNDVQWIKITTDMFDDDKIKLIEALPDADALLVIWIKLICQAGKTNDSGRIYIDEGVPYSDEELATVLNRPVNTVRLAIETFRHYQMIEIEDDCIYLKNFAKIQNTAGLDKIREQSRKRVEKFRQRQKMKLITDGNDNVTLRNVTVTQQNRKEKNIREEENRSFNIWNNVLEILQKNVNNSNYRTWLEGSIGVEIDENEIVVGVKSRLAATYLEDNMSALIQKTIMQACNEQLTPRFVPFGM